MVFADFCQDFSLGTGSSRFGPRSWSCSSVRTTCLCLLYDACTCVLPFTCDGTMYDFCGFPLDSSLGLWHSRFGPESWSCLSVDTTCISLSYRTCTCVLSIHVSCIQGGNQAIFMIAHDDFRCFRLLVSIDYQNLQFLVDFDNWILPFIRSSASTLRWYARV